MNKTILLNSIVGVSTQLKLKSIDLDALVGGLDNERVNLFNLEEPLQGDIVGFNISINDCPDGVTVEQTAGGSNGDGDMGSTQEPGAGGEPDEGNGVQEPEITEQERAAEILTELNAQAESIQGQAEAASQAVSFLTELVGVV